MRFTGKRKLFCFTLTFLFFFFLSASDYTEDPLAKVTDTSWGNRAKELSHAIDTQNCGKGCGALLSHNAQFVMNPSAIMLQHLFSVSLIYQYLDATSVSVSDSATSKVAGGILYTYNSGLHHIKTNFAFPIFPGIVFGGLNLNNYIGKFMPTQNKHTNSHSFDIGISAKILSFLSLGFAALDVWTFSGSQIPRKLSWNAEVSIKNMFFINNGWQYHLESDREKLPNRRKELKNFDFYTGFEFRYSWFRTGIGFNNISFAKSFTWSTTLKTLFLAFYKPGMGGIYGNFMYNESNYIIFSINLVWEPPVS